MNTRQIIVVTGGAGFVGSHLCERLAKAGHRVISLDNYFTGSRDNHVADVEYREGHTKDIERLVPETPDLIYHLGEYSRVEQSVLEPDIVADLNTLGTRGVVEYWKKKKCKLVYAGSSTKFGDDGAARFTSPYARTKAENSELVRDTGETEKLPYAVTYFYNVYGPRERSGVYGTVIEHFKRMYLAGTPCAIVAPGTQERNFTHVDDIVDGLIKVGEGGQGDEYGLGNERAYSIFEVAKLFGFGDNIVLFPPRPGNRMTSGLDTRKARAVGWSAHRELGAYISEFSSSHRKGAMRDKRILVFSTTMHPVAGLAEDSLVELAEALPDVAFDVITSRFSRDAEAKLTPNITLHRVGTGTPFDKFLLPILGPMKGLSLWRKGKYLFAWSLMASYAALAGIAFKNLVGAPLLVTLADQSLDDLPSLHRFSLSLMLSQADQVYGTHGVQEKDAMRAAGAALPRNTLGEGDAFANALRFAYADVVRRRQEMIPARKKRVLVFSLVYYPRHIGGAEVALKEITDRIGDDIEFDMITLQKHAPAYEKIGNVHVYRVGWQWPEGRTQSSDFLPVAKYLFPFLALGKALSLQRTRRYDGIWAMMAAYAGFGALFFKLLNPRVPYILTLQEGDPIAYIKRRALLVYPLFKMIFTKADFVQTISNYLADFARDMGYRGPLAVIPNGADVKEIQAYEESAIFEIKKRLGKKKGDVLLVTASRLVPKNAVDDVIRALPLLPTHVKFIIIGAGREKESLVALAQEQGVSKRVVFAGFVEPNDVGKYLNACDIFIRPSRSEGMGNSFIEAMAAGIPVIATQEGGIADFLFDEKKNPNTPATGWAVDKNSPKQIAEAVVSIMSHPEKTRAVVNTARAMVEEKYDWTLIARDMREKVFSIL